MHDAQRPRLADLQVGDWILYSVSYCPTEPGTQYYGQVLRVGERGVYVRCVIGHKLYPSHDYVTEPRILRRATKVEALGGPMKDLHENDWVEYEPDPNEGTPAEPTYKGKVAQLGVDGVHVYPIIAGALHTEDTEFVHYSRILKILPPQQQ